MIDPSDVREQFEGDEIKLGPSTRIWATDFNKDGMLDLLVGDSTSIISPKDGLTRDQWQEKRDAHQQEMMELSKRQQPIMVEYSKYMEKGEEPPEELEEQRKEFSNEFQKLYTAQNEFQTQKRTGMFGC